MRTLDQRRSSEVTPELCSRPARALVQLGTSFSLVVTLSVSEGSHEMLRCAQHDKPERHFRHAVLAISAALIYSSNAHASERLLVDALSRGTMQRTRVTSGCAASRWRPTGCCWSLSVRERMWCLSLFAWSFLPARQRGGSSQSAVARARRREGSAL